MFSTASQKGFSLKAWRGSSMTLLAMNFKRKPAKNFAGFSIAYINPKGNKYYLKNLINFEGTNEVTSTFISPIQLFRWVHFPGSYQQQGILTGEYTYMATPRFIDEKKKLAKIDRSQTVSVKVTVGDFKKGGLTIGFTRAFLKSQAFAKKYGSKQKLKPSGGDWIFNANDVAGSQNKNDFTYENMYSWLGFSAREMILQTLASALSDQNVSIDMFAYDFNDPVIASLCLQLAMQGNIRIILDNAALHKGPKAEEDDFEKRFNAVATGSAAIFRCHFARYSHCKVIIVKKDQKPVSVLCGSTNFSYTGLLINANHVLLFEHKEAAEYFGEVFDACWQNGKAPPFRISEFATNTKQFNMPLLPTTELNFSPHSKTDASQLIDEITANVTAPGTRSVIFSVMEMGPKTTGSLLPALRQLHKNDKIYSYGITDNSGDEISIYKPGLKNGLLINAKAARRELPPPFQKEANLGLAHAIHHKFVVTNFDKRNARVYCGSSNLALGGETDNGDNLICIKDSDVATAFTIEAIRLTDHYNFRSLQDRKEPNRAAGKPASAIKLDKSGNWFNRFYDPNDIRCIERKLFA